MEESSKEKSISLFDSHAHFDWFDSNGRVDVVLSRAQSAGVDKIIAVGGNASANQRTLRLAKAYPNIILPTVGYDRDQADKGPDISAMRELLEESSAICAIGEIGLDYYYDADTAKQQRQLFEQMLQLSCDYNKPVIVHSRNAAKDTYAMLKDHAQSRENPGVLHCFTEDLDFAQKLIDLGFYIGISGIITFPNAENLRQVVRELPLEKLLIETDCPYLAPVPERGKKNEPAFVLHVAKALSELFNASFSNISAITTKNATTLFSC